MISAVVVKGGQVENVFRGRQLTLSGMVREDMKLVSEPRPDCGEAVSCVSGRAF